MRLTGQAAIDYALQEGLRLNKSADDRGPARDDLTVSEAKAVAATRPDAIWLDVGEKGSVPGGRPPGPGG